MTDETTQIAKGKKGANVVGTSRLAGLSVRGLIMLMICGTSCGLSAAGIKVQEPLYGAFMMVLGALFQQLVRQATPPSKP